MNKTIVIEDSLVSGRHATVDSSGALKVAGAVTVTQTTSPWVISGAVTCTQTTSPWVTLENSATTVYNNKVTTTSGVRVALASSTPVKSVTVKALSTNTGLVYLGNATVTSSNGHVLESGDCVDIDITNLATIYLDVSVTGEGVTYIGVL